MIFNATDSKSCAFILPQEYTQLVLSWLHYLAWLHVSHTTCTYGYFGLLMMPGKSLPWSLWATSLSTSLSLMNLKLGQSPLVTVLVTQRKQDYSHKLVLQKLDHISQNYPCSLLPVLSVLKFSLNVDIRL